jgi:hypothetical protein
MGRRFASRPSPPTKWLDWRQNQISERSRKYQRRCRRRRAARRCPGNEVDCTVVVTAGSRRQRASAAARRALSGSVRVRAVLALARRRSTACFMTHSPRRELDPHASTQGAQNAPRNAESGPANILSPRAPGVWFGTRRRRGRSHDKPRLTFPPIPSTGGTARRITQPAAYSGGTAGGRIHGGMLYG